MRFCSLVILLVQCAWATQAQQGTDNNLWEVGARGGVSGDGDDFVQAEIYGSYDFPWKLDLPWKLSLALRANGNAGILTAQNEWSGLFSLGPGFVIKREGWRISLEAGSSPTLMTRHRFGGKDLGGTLEFINHVGIHCRLLSTWTLSYRFQHLSNAGIHESNPGLNMHLFGIGYRF